MWLADIPLPKSSTLGFSATPILLKMGELLNYSFPIPAQLINTLSLDNLTGLLIN